MASNPIKATKPSSLLRDVLTGRVLTADNVTSSDKEVMKRVLAPVVADSACRCWERSATRKNRSDWRLPRYGLRFRTSCVSFMCCEKPRVPSMNRTAGLSVQMRKAIQQRVRPVRRQLEQQSQTATGAEQEQLAVLADYAKGGANSG